MAWARINGQLRRDWKKGHHMKKNVPCLDPDTGKWVLVNPDDVEVRHCVECPCCGDLAASNLTHHVDGGPLLCGCNGAISTDAEEAPWVTLDDSEPCPVTAWCRGNGQ